MDLGIKDPKLLAWQLVWWSLGIVMIWALCFKAKMDAPLEEQIQRANAETNIVIKEV